jgi:hypothetical protein
MPTCADDGQGLIERDRVSVGMCLCVHE